MKEFQAITRWLAISRTTCLHWTVFWVKGPEPDSKSSGRSQEWWCNVVSTIPSSSISWIRSLIEHGFASSHRLEVSDCTSKTTLVVSFIHLHGMTNWKGSPAEPHNEMRTFHSDIQLQISNGDAIKHQWAKPNVVTPHGICLLFAPTFKASKFPVKIKSCLTHLLNWYRAVDLAGPPLENLWFVGDGFQHSLNQKKTEILVRGGLGATNKLHQRMSR